MSLSQKVRVPLELDGRPFSIASVSADDVPAVRATDEIFERAVARRASDVHLEPCSGGGRVRERVDGMLLESQSFSDSLFLQVVSRIKLLAGMDIADRRLPQDGRYTIERAGRTLDVRVASMPTIEGERLALRILDARAQIPSLEGLGMPSDMAHDFRRLVEAPSGFVVACGPTGSGKTTTLYAALAHRDAATANLCSVEDPVEARIAGVAQVQVNVRAGLDFPSVLRAFLRQDPNVIVVGEMRDAATAGVAVSAALCGQLVLTTLHSGDAPAAVDRLVELGISRRAVAGCVSGILSQRLLRQRCAQCKGDAEEARSAAARGCERCLGTGYWGRSGVFELLLFDDAVREAIAAGVPLWRIRELARGSGYRPMNVAANRLLERGETTREEVERVLGGAPAP